MQDQQKPDPTKQDKKPSVDRPPSTGDKIAIAGLFIAAAVGYAVLFSALTGNRNYSTGHSPHSIGFEDLFHPGLR